MNHPLEPPTAAGALAFRDDPQRGHERKLGGGSETHRRATTAVELVRFGTRNKETPGVVGLWLCFFDVFLFFVVLVLVCSCRCSCSLLVVFVLVVVAVVLVLVVSFWRTAWLWKVLTRSGEESQETFGTWGNAGSCAGCLTIYWVLLSKSFFWLRL